MTQMFLKSKQNNISSPSKPQLAPLLKSIDIFDSEGLYLNNIRLFYAYFGKAPSLKNIPNVDCSRIRKWIETTMPGKIINTHSYEKHYKDQSKITCQYIFYVMNNELLLSLSPERNYAEVVYASGNNYLAQELFDKLKRFKKRDKRTTDINIIISGRSIDLFPIKVKKPTLNISTHYNDDLEPLNNIILKNLNKKNSKGLYLFHGAPGTGKSTYIRYLVHQLKKKVIFMSPVQASGLESPEFGIFLLQNRNAVIVIEDAEELIVSREDKRISSISTLLNLSDGLLADSLGIQVIATFNTNITNVDKALLRKGRLTALYEFKELFLHKSAALVAALGFENYNITKPMSLADIYNIEEAAYQLKPERNLIGFIS